MLLARLLGTSGFSADALAEDRLRAWLQLRGRELGLDAESAARAARDRPEEYARIEAHFAPPETWLFRYPESFSHLRSWAQQRRGERLRVLVLGAGGWCEPVSIACALAEGSGTMPAIEAIDRNAQSMSQPTRFAGADLRGEIPAWAVRFFARNADSVQPCAELVAAITPVIADIVECTARHVASGVRFDVIAFRNASIYLNGETRARIYRAIATLCSDRGIVLVGHSEVQGAAQELGFRPCAMQGAFALERVAPPPAAIVPQPSAQRVASTVQRPAPSPQRLAAEPPSGATAGRGIDATAELRGAVAAQPADAGAHLRLAVALDAAGDREGAAESVQRALYLDRFNEEALLLAARLADARGATADAERLRQRALRVHLGRMRDEERG
jgi:chemotaxis methyl-accepting protein methylase